MRLILIACMVLAGSVALAQAPVDGDAKTRADCQGSTGEYVLVLMDLETGQIIGDDMPRKLPDWGSARNEMLQKENDVIRDFLSTLDKVTFEKWVAFSQAARHKKTEENDDE